MSPRKVGYQIVRDQYHDLWYHFYMRKKSLIETNPYLKDPVKRETMLNRFVISSSAIEGVHAPVLKALGVSKKRKAPLPATLPPKRSTK